MSTEPNEQEELAVSEPVESDGRVTLRMGKSLYAKVFALATKDRMSMNSWLIQAIAHKAALEENSIPSSNQLTHQDVEQLRRLAIQLMQDTGRLFQALQSLVELNASEPKEGATVDEHVAHHECRAAAWKSAEELVEEFKKRPTVDSPEGIQHPEQVTFSTIDITPMYWQYRVPGPNGLGGEWAQLPMTVAKEVIEPILQAAKEDMDKMQVRILYTMVNRKHTL